MLQANKGFLITLFIAGLWALNLSTTLLAHSEHQQSLTHMAALAKKLRYTFEEQTFNEFHQKFRDYAETIDPLTAQNLKRKLELGKLIISPHYPVHSMARMLSEPTECVYWYVLQVAYEETWQDTYTHAHDWGSQFVRTVNEFILSLQLAQQDPELLRFNPSRTFAALPEPSSQAPSLELATMGTSSPPLPPNK